MNRVADDPAGLRASNESCNAREHGLAGDGRTDDQPALAALVDRLGAACAHDGRRRIIHCPPGEYLIRDRTTAWKSGVSLIGAGPGATRFVLDNSGDRASPVALARYTAQEHGAGRENFLSDCTFAEFEIDGTRVELPKYDPLAKGLGLQFMLRARFRDLYIHGTAATGLGCDHLQDSVIQGVVATGCGRMNDGREPGGAGIGIGIGGWGDIERLNIENCIAVGNGTHGIFLELQKKEWTPPRGIKIMGCHCMDNRIGMSDWGAEGLIVSTCVLVGNLEAGYDVSAGGTSSVAGRGGVLVGCMIDGNARDGVRVGNTHGPYIVRECRISNNGRYGYWQHNLKGDDAPAPAIVIEENDFWGNALDGVRLDAPLVDATVERNRVRNSGRRTEGACTGGGPGVSYRTTALRDAGARWPVDGHKGKAVSAGGMTAVVLSNDAHELALAPWRPGASSAWAGPTPAAGTAYALEGTPTIRPGIGINARMRGIWVRSNRIWDDQGRRTQTHSLWVRSGLECRGCVLEDRHA